MSEPTPYVYDVFVSYHRADATWVEDELLPRLEREGLKVIVGDRDFEPGANRLNEMERAALQSRKTLLVLSPAYVESEWAEFENSLVQALDPAARKRRLIPVVRTPCQIQLRIRPLVSVDLTADDDDVQWQRLIKALDPKQAAAVSPIQNLALAISAPSASLPAPGWHPLGSAWLVLGLLGVILLAGLVFILLYDWPALAGTVSAMVGAFTLILGVLGLREDKDFGQRLSHFLGASRPAQVVMAAVLVAAIALWGGAGWPKLQAIVAGPLGPRAPGEQRFAIGEWKNLTPGRSPFEGVWTEGTRRTLYEKLSCVQSLQGIALDSPQVPEEVQRDLDLWIDGDFSKLAEVKLSAALSGRAGKYLQPVSVQGPVDEASPGIESQILDLQDDLARAILSALGIELQPAVVEAIRRTPTGSAEALRLNNQAVVWVAQGNLDGAEPLLRAALVLDPDYADAHNNLGRVFQLRGDQTGAAAEYLRATELLPRIPLFHFNLGLAYHRAQDFSAAIRSYEQAVALDPAYVKAINNLGFVYLETSESLTEIETSELDKATDLFKRGLRLDPNAAYLHKNLGRVYLKQRRTGDAITELKRAVELTDVPYAEALFYLAQAYRDAGQAADACAALASYLDVAAADAADDPSRPPAAKALADELQCP